MTIASEPSPTPGTIVVTGSEPSANAGAVFRIDPATGAGTEVSSAGEFATPVGIAVEADGGILVVDADAFGGRGGVIRVDASNGTQSTVSSGGLFVNPFDIAVEAGGAILVVDPHASGTGGVIRVDPDSGEQTMVSSGQETGGAAALREVGIAIDADGTIIVVEQSLAGGGPANGRVTRIDPVTGVRTALSVGGALSSPAGVAVDVNGSILVADTNAFGGSGGVIQIDPATGDQARLSSGGAFVSPIDIAIDADGLLLVADVDAFGGMGGVIGVDPGTGEQTTLARGGTFIGPRSVAVVPEVVVVPPPPPDTSVPSRVANVRATPGGGSGEIVVTWDPLPASEAIAFYRVYQRRGEGTYWHLAVVTNGALGVLEDHRLGIVDAPDYWPWPTGGVPGPERCYVVTAVSARGVEGPFSGEACATATGG